MTYDELLKQLDEHSATIRIIQDGKSQICYAVTDSTVHWYVKQAYELGNRDEWLESLDDSDDIYQRGYDKGFEAGKAEGFNDRDFIEQSEYNRGYNDAAKDPKAWYVLDKNGEHVHIGDKVKLTNGETVTVQGLGSCAIFAVPRGSGYTTFETDYFEKVIPDTREKVIKDFASIFGCTEITAEKFVARVEALGES